MVEVDKEVSASRDHLSEAKERGGTYLGLGRVRAIGIGF